MDVPMEKQGESHRRTPGCREDLWSEDATETLIAAWGDRFVKLNRGYLSHKDWTEVAGAVNYRHGDDGRPKSNMQCKNRIDTLKKRYKTEKAKPSQSTWRFFDRIDSLIRPVWEKPQSAAAASGRVKSAPENPIRNSSWSNFTDSSLEDDEDDSDDEGEEWGFVPRKHRRIEYSDLSDGAASWGELVKAMLKFGEIYERIEIAKQKVLLELEKQRLEMTKEVELQKTKKLTDMQLELLQNLKHKNTDPDSGKQNRPGEIQDSLIKNYEY